MLSLAVAYESEDLYPRACALAAQLQLPMDNHAPWQIRVTAEKLVLKTANFVPLYADFSFTTWQKRQQAGKKQGLIRACKPKPQVKIIDATAGWGRDAAILASFGAEVIMLERHPIMAALLEDALERRDALSQSRLHVSLVRQDAFTYLKQLPASAYPQIIYLDPMHPVRHKSALVKKELQVLQHMIGSDDDAQELLSLALTKACDKVVVKWPQSLAPLLAPTGQVAGKTVRFDIYQVGS